MTRPLGPAGKALLKGYETGGWNDASGKLHLLPKGEPALKTYIDDVGVPTIGWGHTRGVQPGQVITREQAEVLLASDTAAACAAVEKACAGKATSQDQFDAMVCLTFNIGAGGFISSTVLRKHLAGDYRSAAAAFGPWNKGRVGGKLVELRGLTLRRAEEAAIYAQGSPA